MVRLLLPYGFNEFFLKGKAVTTYGWTVSWQIQWLMLHCTVKYSILQNNNHVPCYCTQYQHTEHKFPSTLGYRIMLYTALQQKIHSSNFFMPFHCLVCLEPAEGSNGKILLIIFQELEHIPALKKYQ
jgi:hypothetical protein